MSEKSPKRKKKLERFRDKQLPSAPEEYFPPWPMLEMKGVTLFRERKGSHFKEEDSKRGM